MDTVAFLLDDDVDANRFLEIDAIVINEALRLEAPILPFREGPAQPCFRYFEQTVEAGEHLCLAVLGRELVEPPLAKAIGTELPADVAKHELWRAAVGADDAFDVTDRLEAALIAHGGKMQALVEGLARLPGAASRHRPADVALVRDRAAEAEQRALAEHRADDAHVGRVRAAPLIRMIDQEGIAFRDAVAIFRDDRAAAGREGA